MKKNNDRKSTLHGLTLKELQVLKDTTVSQFIEFLLTYISNFFDDDDCKTFINLVEKNSNINDKTVRTKNIRTWASDAYNYKLKFSKAE